MSKKTIKNRNLIFLGAPGAGKGTLADMLCGEYEILHISTGDILRNEIKNGTELGKKAGQYVTSGGLVPDQLIVDMVGTRLSQKDCGNGFILDGFPRTLVQAELLEGVLKKINKKIDKVIYFQVDDELLIRRLTARIICEKCGTNFNKIFSPPKKEGLCDKCGGELYQREDDSLEKAQFRLKVYNEQTAPLIPYYKEKNMLSLINAGQMKNASYQKLIEALS